MEKFYSSNIFIMESNDSNKYLVFKRWINYRYHSTFGFMTIIPKKYKSLTSKFYHDTKFNVITSEEFLEDECYKRGEFSNGWSVGHEDLRLFQCNGKIYYIGSISNPVNKLPAMSCNIFQSENEINSLIPNIITTIVL